MSDMPERIWACVDDTAHLYSPKGYWIVNNHDSEDVEYIRADLVAERERESAQMIKDLIALTGETAGSDPAGALITRAEGLLAKIDKENEDG